MASRLLLLSCIHVIRAALRASASTSVCAAKVGVCIGNVIGAVIVTEEQH